MIISGEYFVIKPVGENEINEILDVYRQCEDFLALGPVPYASEQMVLDDLKLSREEGGVFCGIFIDSEMVGIIDFTDSGLHGNADEAHLSLLMISAKHRSKGIGKDAVNAVESVIRKNTGIKSILSGVQVNNKSAIAFWNKMGYEIVSGPEKRPDLTTVYNLKKELA